MSICVLSVINKNTEWAGKAWRKKPHQIFWIYLPLLFNHCILANPWFKSFFVSLYVCVEEVLGFLRSPLAWFWFNGVSYRVGMQSSGNFWKYPVSFLYFVNILLCLKTSEHTIWVVSHKHLLQCSRCCHLKDLFEISKDCMNLPDEKSSELAESPTVTSELS